MTQRNSTFLALISARTRYEPVIEWIGNGKLPTEGVVTHTFPLEKFKEAFELAGKGKSLLKVVLIPGWQGK